MKILRLLPRFRAAEQAMVMLADREGWARARIEALQLERLNQVWSHASRHVPHYRALSRTRSLPETFDSWQEFESLVPVLEKRQVRTTPENFLSERAEPGRWTLTGGSSGMPMLIFWSHRAHLEMLQTKYRFHAQWDVGMLDRTAFVWGRAASRPSGWRGRWQAASEALSDRLRSRLRISAYHLGRNDLRLALNRLQRFRPTMIYGFSHALLLLANMAQAEGFHCEALKLCILTAEPASARLQQAVSAGFGVPTATEYGATECGLIAYQDPAGSLRVREDIVRVETLPREDGRYDIVLTVLVNGSFPLLRYAIGDTTDAPLEYPSRGFACLQNIGGREDDLLYTPQGGVLHPASVDAIFESGDYPGVLQYQVHQASDGAVRVLLELASEANVHQQRLHEEFARLLQGYPVVLEIASSIPKAASGKHRAVFSQLSRPQNTREVALAQLSGNSVP